MQQRNLNQWSPKGEKKWRKLMKVDWKSLWKRIYQEKKRASLSSPKRGPGFSSLQGLSRAANHV